MFGYWVSLGVLFVMTVTAWRPPRRPGWLATATYLNGWLVNEIPLIALAALAATTALTAAEGHLSPFGPAQVSAVVLAAVILGLLVWLLVRARSSRAVFHGALTDAGIELDRPIAARRTPGRAVRSYLLPFVRRSRSVRHIRNVPYGEHGKRNLLDVYVPKRGVTRGVFINFHGGHFRIGHKDSQSLPLIYELARSGWLCVSANYRLEPRWFYPAPVVDAKRVIAWAKEHAPEYGADAHRIVASGDSAGGYLALYAALTPRDRRLQSGFEDADTSVSAALVLYGYLGPTDGTMDSAPFTHVTADAPPVFLVQGTHDNAVPIGWTYRTLTALREGSRSPVAYAELPGAHHTFDYVHSVRTDALVDATHSFLDWLDASDPHNSRETVTS